MNKKRKSIDLKPATLKKIQMKAVFKNMSAKEVIEQIVENAMSDEKSPQQMVDAFNKIANIKC